MEGREPLAAAGDISPHTRTSVTWPQSKAPFKPEIVMEAGNRAVIRNAHRSALTTHSLSLLTTGADVIRQPLTPFWATSAAAVRRRDWPRASRQSILTIGPRLDGADRP